MKNKNIINFEALGGWPVYKMNLREILQKLGATLNKETNKWEIPESSTLDVFPCKLKDDGMGYGVDKEYIIETNLFEENGETYCNIFTDYELEYIDIWRQANTFPGDSIKHNRKEYILCEIDETDEGMMFKCYNLKHVTEYVYIPLDEVIKKKTEQYANTKKRTTTRS